MQTEAREVADAIQGVGGAVAAVPGAPITFLVSHSSAGGVQQIWANLAESFRDLGFDVRLIALYPYHSAEAEKSEGMPWTYIVGERPRSPFKQLAMLRALVAFFREHKPGVTFTAMPAANVLVPIAASLAGTGSRIVTSHHSPVDTYHPLLNVADGLVGGLPAVQAIISVSDAVKTSQNGRSRGYRAKTVVIHNALPPAIERRLEALAAGVSRAGPSGRAVVAAGRLAAQKNYPVLIRSVAHMPDIHLSIVGSGEDEVMLKDLARDLGVSDRIAFLGHRSRDETLSLMAKGDVFVQPSLFEGHSLALIEAAKLGLPLVVSDVPVQVEGVTAKDGTRCGLIAPADDPVALANAMLSLLDDEALYARYADLSQHLGSTATYARMLAAYRTFL